MDLEFFHKILSVDSTSGREEELADILSVELAAPGRKIDVFEVGDGTRNVLVSWGTPKVIFCTHLDTVPPYIPPVFEGSVVRGRGSADAKGQIFAMFEACMSLRQRDALILDCCFWQEKRRDHSEQRPLALSCQTIQLSCRA